MLFLLSFDGIDYRTVARSENDLATERTGIPDTANCISKSVFFVPKGKPFKIGDTSDLGLLCLIKKS